MEAVREFTYLGDRVSDGGGCEAAVTADQYVGGLSLGSVVSCCMARYFLKAERGCYKSYIRPAILYGSEAWCLNENEMGILCRTESSIVSIVQLKDRR